MRNERLFYEFDDFRVDSGQFLLMKQGQTQPITPTVFRILLLLLENAGRIVTKEELIAAIWPDSFVEEGNLNRNVSTLRKALGETPRDHRYIETAPKSGYRFIAPVRQTPANAQPVRQVIVGRETERQTLLAAFQRMKEGHGGILCLSGEVGIAVAEAFLAYYGNDGYAQAS